MYSTFQADRTDRPHLGSNQWKAVPLPSSLPAPFVCYPTQKGEVVRLEWLARRGQLCDHRPLSVCMWDGGRDPQALLQTQLHTGPHKQLLHSQWQPLLSSSNTAGFVLWQHENEYFCNYQSQTYLASSIFNAYFTPWLVDIYMEKWKINIAVS